MIPPRIRPDQVPRTPENQAKPRMRSARGFVASIVFLLAFPLAALCQIVLHDGASAVIHIALAVGSALMALAVFDFRTPKWATCIASISTGVLAVVFCLQGASDLTLDPSLTQLAYRMMGQRLEGWLVNLFMAWCVVVLIFDSQGRARFLGIIAMTIVACVNAYAYGLAHDGTSLDARAPILKVLWLMPFVWLLFESKKGRSADAAPGVWTGSRGSTLSRRGDVRAP